MEFLGLKLSWLLLDSSSRGCYGTTVYTYTSVDHHGSYVLCNRNDVKYAYIEGNAKTNQKTAIIVICIETVCIILLTIALVGLLSSNFVLLPICVIVQMVMLLGSMWFVIKTYLLLNKVKKGLTMSLRCQAELNWYEVGKETPRDDVLLFLVTDKEPDIIYSGFCTNGQFRITGQLGGILMLKDSNVTVT